MFNKKLFFFSLVTLMTVSACGQRAANSQDAIEQAKAKQTVEEQVNFLVSQANTFVKSEKFDDAIKTAKYILAELDKESAEAKSVIELAKVEMEKIAQQKVEEAKAEANKAVDDVKGKISSFGQ